MWATATGKRLDYGSVQFGPMYISWCVPFTKIPGHCIILIREGFNDVPGVPVIMLTEPSGLLCPSPACRSHVWLLWYKGVIFQGLLKDVGRGNLPC